MSTLHNVRIKQDAIGGPIKMWIDGQENPLVIARYPIAVNLEVGGVTTLTVAILCETMEVECGLGHDQEAAQWRAFAEQLRAFEDI
jgi:hypothetical protein